MFTVEDPTIPRELLGPTGLVFVHPPNYSTELGAIVQLPQGYVRVPLLVPGQQGIGGLLQGQKPTHEQMAHAIEHAMSTNYPMTPFPSEAEALAAEKQRHDQLARQLMPFVQPYLNRKKGDAP